MVKNLVIPNNKEVVMLYNLAHLNAMTPWAMVEELVANQCPRIFGCYYVLKNEEHWLSDVVTIQDLLRGQPNKVSIC